MTHADFLRVKAEARATMEQLAKLFPGCFHADGRPIVAELRLPTIPAAAPKGEA